MQFRTNDLNSSYYLSLTRKNQVWLVQQLRFHILLASLVGEIVAKFDKNQTRQLVVIFRTELRY